MCHEETFDHTEFQHLPRPLVIGIGNPQRKDDGAGPAVIRGLRAAFDASGDTCPWDLLECHGDPASLIEILKDRSCVLLIDAVTSGSPTGTLHLLDAAQPLPTALFSVPSTHNLGLAEALELARAFEQLPLDVRVVGIEAEDMGYGTSFSPGMDQAVRRVTKALLHLAKHLHLLPTRLTLQILSPEGESRPPEVSDATLAGPETPP